MSLVIVGAGVLGSALARVLARAGHDVTIIEQHEAGDDRAASVARSRLLRLAHADDAADTLSASEARRGWLQLEQDTGTRLYDEVGMAWFAPADDPTWEEQSRSLLAAQGVETERLEPTDARRLFPELVVDDLDHVLLERQAGLLRPRPALEALVTEAVEHGACVVRARARPAGGAVAIDGRLTGADRIVWACGAWTPALFPELVRGRAIQQDVLYLRAPSEWARPGVPAWGEHRRGITGAGDFDGAGFKVGPDVPGPPVDLDAETRRPVREQEELARAYLAARFPTLATAPLRAVESCQTVVLEPGLPDPEARLGGEVRVVRHPEHEHVWLLGDGSGHAFKHAPAIATAVAALLDG